jgi:hypothetical protein
VPSYGRSLVSGDEVVALVACPDCGARKGQPCVGLKGRATNHRERIKAARKAKGMRPERAA